MNIYSNQTVEEVLTECEYLLNLNGILPEPYARKLLKLATYGEPYLIDIALEGAEEEIDALEYKYNELEERYNKLKRDLEIKDD